jgi:hypothetical protein
MKLYPYQKTILDAINTIPEKLNFKYFELNMNYGKSLATMESIKYVMATGKSLAIGTANVDALHDRIKQEYPNAKLTKQNGYVLVEKS